MKYEYILSPPAPALAFYFFLRMFATYKRRSNDFSTSQLCSNQRGLKQILTMRANVYFGGKFATQST